MRLIKEIVKEVLKIFLGIIWFVSYGLGYIFMSIPEVMIICFVINTACIAIMYCGLRDPESDIAEEDKEMEEKKSMIQLIWWFLIKDKLSIRCRLDCLDYYFMYFILEIAIEFWQFCG